VHRAPATAAAPAGDAAAALPGLYVHVPFCSAICPYCDFAVLVGGPERRSGFVDALAAEARAWAERWPHRGVPLDTVYLGGGTPSALSPAQLAATLDALRSALPVAADAWLTLEANPEDVTTEALAAWRELGVGTLSLGVQSFDDAALRFLGRRHDGVAARRAVSAAVGAGFPIVSVDLIYGLPGQSAAAWRRDLAAATELAPQHLSCYQLTIHEGTPFGFRAARGALVELPDEGQAELFRLTHEELAARGWPGYEVSNFARSPAFRSRHNRKYWRHVPYLGLGPSAHSFDGVQRWWNHRKLAPWQAAVAAGGTALEGSETLVPREIALEHLLLGLRSDGVDLARLRELGLDLAAPAPAAAIDRAAGAGLVRVADGRLIATLAGWAVADGLAVELAAAADGRDEAAAPPRASHVAGAGPA
jgi:putative oxygen-independent coproporphyrinogen III oxidase